MSSKKNTLNKKPLLIDTSFLLPALGIQVEEEILEAISRFRDYNIHYIEMSLIEAIWSVIKRVDLKDMEVVKLGIEAIRDTYRRIENKSTHFIKAWEVYIKAHRDFVDDLLYATSIVENIPLLTIDKTLKKNLDKNNFPTNNIIFPDQL